MESADQPRFPMRAVARKTALSPHVIRIWERRYGAVTPSRTDTNHRLYTEDDVRRLTLLRDATAQGHSIGLIAGLSSAALRALLEEDRTNQRVTPTRSEKNVYAESSATELLENCLRATKQLDRHQLEMHLNRASTVLSIHDLLDGLVGPLMERVGSHWRTGELRPSDEHMATDVVRTFLSARRATYTPSDGAPVIVVTTPIGQVHEIGALMVSMMARAEGWKDIYLGPNLPADDIVAAVMKSNAKALALSIVYPANDARIENELAFLHQQLPAGTQVFAGGRAADAYRDAILHMGAKLFYRLAEFREALHTGLPPVN